MRRRADERQHRQGQLRRPDHQPQRPRRRPASAIAMTGPTPMSGTTDADGCIRFNEMDGRQLHARASTAAARSRPRACASVSEPPGRRRAARRAARSTSSTRPARCRSRASATGARSRTRTRRRPAPSHVSIAHGALGQRDHRRRSPAADLHADAALYPFTSAYGVYADNCTNAAPVGDRPAQRLDHAEHDDEHAADAARDEHPARATASAATSSTSRRACGNTLGPRPLVNTGASAPTTWRLRDGFPYASGADANNMHQVCVVRTSTNPGPLGQAARAATTTRRPAGSRPSSDTTGNGFDLQQRLQHQHAAPAAGPGFTP